MVDASDRRRAARQIDPGLWRCTRCSRFRAHRFSIARPINQWAYESAADLSVLAAAYAFGLTKNRGYVDGNKRIGFLAMGAFLFMNGFLLEASEPEAVIVMLELAAGERTEEELASWIRDHLQARP